MILNGFFMLSRRGRKTKAVYSILQKGIADVLLLIKNKLTADQSGSFQPPFLFTCHACITDSLLRILAKSGNAMRKSKARIG
jgi:hypothetical protein